MTINIDDTETAQRPREGVMRRPAAIGSIHDPLLLSLAALTALLDHPMSAEALRAGLPVLDERLSPEMIMRAAARAGLAAAWRKRALTQIPPADPPADRGSRALLCRLCAVHARRISFRCADR
jgi:hypothetical protein